MTFSRCGTLLLLTLASLGRLALGAEPGPPADPEILAADAGGVLEIDTVTGAATARGGVVLKYRGVTLTARSVKLAANLEQVEAEGDVRIEGGRARLWRGDRVKYTFATEAVEADNFRLGQPPFFASGRTLVGAGSNTVYQSTGGILTTDDLARPGYRIQARSLKLVPGEKLEAVGATVYLGDTPVGYFPRLTRSLERHPNFWSVSPGYRQVYGAFLESTYHWFARTNLEATANLDYRTARGVSGGPGVHYDFGKWGRGDGLAYLIDDDNPFRTARGVPVDEDRHVLRFRHSLTNDSGLAFKGRYEGQNDALARRDFFEWDFRRDPQPRTFAEVSQAWSNWTLDALAQPQ
ncbi:MAG: hypothetical protein ACKOET_04620, partial [Verrucomicrobiota bacterium]